MKLEQIELPVSNQLLFDYWSDSEKLHSFYQYNYSDDSFVARYNYLKNNQHPNNELSEIIRSYMEPLGISPKANEHLDDLANGSVAIVGGQQAGILTGPLYSVHKAISVVLLAKEQSEKLGEKVVPIFWIAGEDHDIEEINHTYTIVNGVAKKRIYEERSRKKTMASATKFNKERLINLINTVFFDYGETEYTQELHNFVLQQVEQSETFTQFFALTMNELFKNEGLLMIDAAYFAFRKYESSYFVKLIDKNEQISKVVVAKENELNEKGYGAPINAVMDNANLFYVQDGERFLLERKNGNFQDASGQFKFTKEHLIDIATTTPENLSNNVVTRPLMQEMAIPVLAFVGGPGELAYWATLKDAFEVLDLQMPILAPRLNITLLTSKTNQLLMANELTLTHVVNGTVDQLKQNFISTIQDQQANQQIDEINKMLIAQYEALSEYLKTQQLNLENILEKNKNYHKMQLDYLSKKIEQEVLIKHDKKIRQFDLLNAEIFPNGTPQERIYNPFQYMNIYGPTLVEELCSLPMKISNKHYIVQM